MRGSRWRRSGLSSGFEVLIHGPVREYLSKLEELDRDDAKLCADALAALVSDPFRSRPEAEIERWKGPEFDYCLRRGRHNFGYRVEKNLVRVIDVWFK